MFLPMHYFCRLSQEQQDVSRQSLLGSENKSLFYKITLPGMAYAILSGMKNVALLLIFSCACIAQNYKAEQASDHGVPVVHLVDASNGVEVSILPSIGNRAYEMKVHGKNILYFPIPDLSQAQKAPGLNGIPFLAPWSNRLGEQAFWANGKKY